MIKPITCNSGLVWLIMTHSPIILVFDLDNTLVHSKIDFLGIRTALADWALKKGFQDTSEFQQMPISDIISQIETVLDSDSTTSHQIWQIVEEFEEKGMMDAIISDDVVPALQRIRSLGIKTAVFTNNSSKSAAPALEKFQLGPFDVVKTRDNVRAMKPSGAGVLEIIQLLSGTLENTYLVGDSWVDGLCAQNAGVKFIAFGKDRFAQIEERKIPYHTKIENMEQLLDFAKEKLVTALRSL
ncbi:MAG: HAD family hydrolase [Candidatus Hodarchaeota archaeon]